MLRTIFDRADRGVRPRILAVETAVVDLQYDAGAGHDALKREFFATLADLIREGYGTPTFDENPRAGDMRLIPAEDFDAALIAFGHRKKLPFLHKLARAQAQMINEYIFGKPVSVAGGSLANTLHGVVYAGLYGRRLVDGKFVTAVGDDESGRVFAQSLDGHIHYDAKGRQMECHVYPIDGDRILIATPSKHYPAEAHIRANLLDQQDMDGCDRIMLGGFLFFTPVFDEIFDRVIAHLSALPAGQRPSVAITAAAQAVSANPAFRAKLRQITGLTDVVIHANTGEFRRLMDMDTDWRKPFDADFAGLDGQDLDAAKDKHAPYQAAKVDATRAALDEAVRFAKTLGHDLRFVVTNGARATYVAGRNGYESFAPEKLARDKIVNTVGAGDNFAAGFQLGDLYGMAHESSVALGHDFAQAVIQQPGARLDKNARASVRGRDGVIWRLDGPLAFAKRRTLENPKPDSRNTSRPQP